MQGLLTFVQCSVATPAKRDQILQLSLAALSSGYPVVNLEMSSMATAIGLAPESIAP